MGGVLGDELVFPFPVRVIGKAVQNEHRFNRKGLQRSWE
jgi:hypothetical protein